MSTEDKDYDLHHLKAQSLTAVMSVTLEHVFASMDTLRDQMLSSDAEHLELWKDAVSKLLAAIGSVEQIRRALDGRDFIPRPDGSFVTQDLEPCDLCGRNFSSGLLRPVVLVHGDQAKRASSVCLQCLGRLGFRDTSTVETSAWLDWADHLEARACERREREEKLLEDGKETVK
ncbi:hypothetical protein [Bifidobacterium sp. ESL0745]|uniref:hypothetical protein n=1 Tax=Bifidobacterium sp. ESL0745 TaxID=2983226 RepID=UPI0023F7B619|nr:hypothetical protein [Bifidobacterium sp. ESL0745]MDF7665710.1 hypothetical protein [Bifidobacterium sp. ESL0745]